MSRLQGTWNAVPWPQKVTAPAPVPLTWTLMPTHRAQSRYLELSAWDARQAHRALQPCWLAGTIFRSQSVREHTDRSCWSTQSLPSLRYLHWIRLSQEGSTLQCRHNRCGITHIIWYLCELGGWRSDSPAMMVPSVPSPPLRHKTWRRC